jgi:hypothetical protein
MDRFLDKHKDIDRDLAKNPSLCNDDKYLKHHKELRAFLDKNPEVRTQVASNARTSLSGVNECKSMPL